MVEGSSWNEPVNQGEVQIINSGISELGSGGESPHGLQGKAHREPCVLAIGPAGWVTTASDRQACKDAE